MSKMIRASSKTPCIICGARKWPCWYQSDRGKAYCKNIYAEKTSCDGLFMHFEDGIKTAPRVVKPEPQKIIERASADQRHKVYSALLSALSLSNKHTDNLMARGLPLSEIEARGYRTVFADEKRRELTRQLAPLGLAGVPGFYRFNNEFQMVRCLPGFLVPYRDSRGRILGMMTRLDVPIDKNKYIWFSSNPDKYAGGSSSGAPLHFARPELFEQAKEVWLTEGALKADIASYYLDAPFIASAGVSQWGGKFGEAFKHRFPDKRIVVAYDNDWTRNRDVRMALERLMDQLKTAGVSFVVRSWAEDYKGIDDLVVGLSRESEVVAA